VLAALARAQSQDLLQVIVKNMALVTNIDFALARAPLAHDARPENYIAPQSDTINAAFKREAW